MKGVKLLLLTLLIVLLATPAYAAYKFKVNDSVKGSLGIWGQTWYQYVEDGKDANGNTTMGEGKEDLHDFQVRRVYFTVNGDITPLLSLHATAAVDRMGQEGLNNSGMGLGTGVAWREFWAKANINESFKIQMGRMYVPLTRNYGTTSTFKQLTTDLTFAQGGIRGGIFYASKVGRDDGITFWGNPFNGKVQYRLMVSEGVEGAQNHDDNLRYVGRVSFNFLEAEKGWFNAGTYLGKKKVFNIGIGVDYQDDLLFAGQEEENTVWTIDTFIDYPLGAGSAITLEAAYIDIDTGTQNINYTNFAAGDDGDIMYVQAGYLFPGGKFQPYVRYETVSPDDDVQQASTGKDDTDFFSLGANYYFKGHQAKLSLDYTEVDQDDETLALADHSIVTLQVTLGL